MTRGDNGKSKMLGRLIFGEKRKQAASPSRHRSSTRNRGNATDAKSSGSGGGSAVHKDPINIHDWAVWRMHLNEQMSNGMTDQMALKQIRQFLQSNPFYQQHSRDPSNGRYNAVRLLFSIPHAKLQPAFNDESRDVLVKNAHTDVGETRPCDQNNAHSNIDDRYIDDRSISTVNPVPASPSMLTDKMISQYLPKKLTGNTDGFLQVDENMIAADTTRTRRSMRASYTAADRVHSTLQKAVKDGNVLEKIKAFEMQAAAVQAELTPKLGGGTHRMSNRMQSTAHCTLSPPMVRSNPHPISPIPMQHESQQQSQYIRSHRSRHVHPVQQRRDAHLAPMMGRESRKGAHVLEPAHGDIILKRRTPSQKTINDEDYSMTMMSSMAPTISQSHHHRQRHHNHRASASRSRHRQDTVHEKRSSSHNDHIHKKHAQKQKEPTTTSTTDKTSTRRRWLIGRKETTTENGKQDATATKLGKTEKNKKKNNEKERVEASKKATSPEPKGKQVPIFDDNNVYDVPKTTTNDSTIAEPVSSQFPPRIDEENEADQEEQNSEDKTNPSPAKDEEKMLENQEYDAIHATDVEQRLNKSKNHPRLQSTDGEIVSKTEDDTRFSRPTDDHAHRSDLNDEDDEYKSDGDVFIEDSSLMNAMQRQVSPCSVEGTPSDRRWQWSKETGGLVEKGNRKKKAIPIIVITSDNQINEDEQERMGFEASQSQKNHSSPAVIPNERNSSKQLLHTMINSKKLHQEQPITDEFFENGPYSNPEETIAHVTSSA